MYTASELVIILGCDDKYISQPDLAITILSTDTRKLHFTNQTLFFALPGSIHLGSKFVDDAIQQGVKNIVTSEEPKNTIEGINYFIVQDVLAAMQKLAAYHRSRFDLPILAITGSNGKTTIKEWLYQMIKDRQLVVNPMSYNSQTGVPLSVWQLKESDELGIFEAGISKVGEMSKLARIIKPTFGLFTMLGDAHDEGFTSTDQKLQEKLLLFEGAKYIIYNADEQIIDSKIKAMYPDKVLCTWGKSEQSTLFTITQIWKEDQNTLVSIFIKEYGELILTIPFSEDTLLKNALHCVAFMLVIGIPIEGIKEALQTLHTVPMRLDMKRGVQNSLIINDTYNADIESLKIALSFLQQQAGLKEKAVILSDFVQSGLSSPVLLQTIANLVQSHGIAHVIAVGPKSSDLEKFLDPFILFDYAPTTNELLDKIGRLNLAQKAILIKGARIFELERVAEYLSEKSHTATLETDIQAIDNNIRVYSEGLQPKTKIIVVIKASAYGSGSEELAKFLEFKKVSYLAVAFVDEGVQLRKANISLPIIILNPDKSGINDMIQYDLEPEVYSFGELKEIVDILNQRPKQSISIHIKIDSGMHRLGFHVHDSDELARQLLEHNNIRVKSIFSHLSSSEDVNDDEYTHYQVKGFNQAYERLIKLLNYNPPKHILNSAGILRFPQYHFDYVRLGLGLYGIDSNSKINHKLVKAHTLKASVVQIKEVKEGEYIGYNRKGVVKHDGLIAIINIGYADGFMRLAGNGKYSVSIRDKDYPVIGNICMDLTIIDLGQSIDVSVGDEVIIFGKNKPIEILAATCQTIPYEILTRISTRVKRYYIQG